MNLSPTQGLAFIIEDKKETTTKSGIVLALKNDNVGAMGRIHSINPVSYCPHCSKEYKRDDLKVGDHVVYSKFVAEHVEIQEVEKEHGGRLFSCPIDSILAVIHD